MKPEFTFFGREWNGMNEECHSIMCLGLQKRKGESSEPIKNSYRQFDAIKYIRWLLIHVTSSSYWGVKCPRTPNRNIHSFNNIHYWLLCFYCHFRFVSVNEIWEKNYFFPLKLRVWVELIPRVLTLPLKTMFAFLFSETRFVLWSQPHRFRSCLHFTISYSNFFHAHLFFSDTLQLNSPP